jgi:hypothetical protein
MPGADRWPVCMTVNGPRHVFCHCHTAELRLNGLPIPCALYTRSAHLSQVHPACLPSICALAELLLREEAVSSIKIAAGAQGHHACRWLCVVRFSSHSNVRHAVQRSTTCRVLITYLSVAVPQVHRTNGRASRPHLRRHRRSADLRYIRRGRLLRS